MSLSGFETRHRQNAVPYAPVYRISPRAGPRSKPPEHWGLLMVRKMLTIVVLAFIGLVGTGGLATAAPYPPPPQNSISITITVVNGVVTVVGTGFFAGEPITITIT